LRKNVCIFFFCHYYRFPEVSTMAKKKEQTAADFIADLIAHRYTLTAIREMLKGKGVAYSMPMLCQIKLGQRNASDQATQALRELAHTYGLSSVKRRA
jgi:hypothetical protein